MSESVAQRLAALRWPPYTPPLTVWLNGKWADSAGKRTDLKIWTVTVDSRSLFKCPLHPPHPHSEKQDKGTSFRDQRIVVLVSMQETMIIMNVRL